MQEIVLVVMLMTAQGRVEPVIEGRFRSLYACEQAKREYQGASFGIQCMKVDKN
jgi:hypothetical protein